MNLVMKQATSWAAILVSATLVAGVYGMNFEYMPELDWRLGYPMALSLMGLISAVLYVTFKRKDWL
jgi:magnesium transporter